jgi:hypothetical protein
MRDYGKVHTRFWSSDTIRSLSDSGRLLAMYLMTSPHSNIAGVFRLPDGYVCEDMQWTPEQVAQGFSELFAKGFANRCETTKWVWIIKHLEWNQPENPNQRKSAAKIAQSVPSDCAWRLDFIRVCGPSLGLEPEPKSNPSLTVVKPFPNQEQEQEQEQEQDEETSSPLSAAGLPTCPHLKLLDLFGKHLPELPQPKPELWKGAKSKHMRARWVWVMTATKSSNGKRYAESAEQAVDFFDRYFGYVAKSDFLTGRNGKWSNCTLAWLMEEANFAKVLEGTYENKAAA